MQSNPILEEVWRVKDELAREAGYDLRTMGQQTRKWADDHLPPGRNVFTAEELRRLAAKDPADAKA